MPIGHNQVLGDPATAPANRPHRVALANWPATIEDTRTRTFDTLLGHTATSGYEGVEFSLPAISKYFPDDAPLVVARRVRAALAAHGLSLFGSTLHLSDAQARAHRWLESVVEQMRLVQEMGGAFASVQFSLHDDYVNTGGAYRQDEDYLRWCADRITAMRHAAWELGLNFYLEVHVDRVTEDPAACCRLLELATCELNGDMSHYLARGFLRGPHVDRVLSYLGHAHVRMARKLGDLSAAVDDAAADWDAGGVTWQMFQFMLPGLAGGLSSRAIVGETGPMHLVKDTLTLDAALVPLYRAMARYADASAQGIALRVGTPADLRPWG